MDNQKRLGNYQEQNGTDKLKPKQRRRLLKRARGSERDSYAGPAPQR
jgi:hypothetical protein